MDNRLPSNLTIDLTEVIASAKWHELLAYLRRLPSLNLSASDRSSIRTRFGLSEEELCATLIENADGKAGSAPMETMPSLTQASPPLVAGLFSFYEGGGIENTKPTAAINLAELHRHLVSSKYSAQTQALREAALGSPERKARKQLLDYVTPAGLFSHRARAGLLSISGLMVLDFDHLPDVDKAKAALLADELLAPGLVMFFTSPSGDGLKAIVLTDTNESHHENFRVYGDYLKGKYQALGLVPDEAGKDLPRACFVPYDPDAWLSPEYSGPEGE